MASNVRITDGSWKWLGGVDSGKVPTIASELIPNGLKRNQLAWMTNCTVRGGGVTPRTGWIRLAKVHPGNALYQGGFLYDNFIQQGVVFDRLIDSIMITPGVASQDLMDCDKIAILMSARKTGYAKAPAR